MQKLIVPSSVELKNKVFENEEQLNDYVDNLKIYSYERDDIDMLEERLLNLEDCPLKNSLLDCIKLRKHKLRLLEQWAQLEKDKMKLEQDQFQFEVRKQDFHEDIQIKKLGLRYLRPILALAMFLIINCGIYAVLIRYSQFATQLGIILNVKQAAALFRIAIFALALGVFFTTFAFCLFGCYVRNRIQKKSQKGKKE